MKVSKDDPCRCELRDFFAKRLLLIRDELDLTQMEFALDLGIDRRSYHDLENRKSLCCALILLVYLCFFCADSLAVLRERKDIIKKYHVVKHLPFHWLTPHSCRLFGNCCYMVLLM